ncbi:di-trans,poly-cis-decaprenylcistransferase [Candidatus Micrarchaeota archaeon]|nr:di-trans,poly-cis-decaprenylcistransferase [Candidatus Micrarchaeota archaeon]
MRYPSSVAVIPDGNRRFAHKNHLSLADAYKNGFSKIEQVVQWLQDTPVQSLRVWALSLENYRKRSRLELEVLFQLMNRQLDRALEDPALKKADLRVRFFGKTQLLPKTIQEKIRVVEEKTADRSRELGVAIAYSGRDEIASAARLAALDFKAGKIADIDETTFARYLYSQQPVDLVIRTGAVQRLSGFLPWQNAYAEVYFSDKLWPEFQQEDLQDALDFYGGTQRRFGK